MEQEGIMSDTSEIKYRFRRGWFGKAILQVTELYEPMPYDALDLRDHWRWRDATYKEAITYELENEVK